MLPTHSSITRFTTLPKVLLFIFIFSLGLVPNTVFADTFSTTQLGEVCFAVADEAESNGTDTFGDTLTVLDRTTAIATIIGATNTFNIEAITFGPSLQLYAADGHRLGTLDLNTGDFTAIGVPFGTGRGELGDLALTDVDGLAYSLSQGIFFGTHRRERPSSQVDLLFAINPSTGALIPDYFGTGVDYVTVDALDDGTGNLLADVDEIEFDPITGILYATVNDGGSGGVLATIDIPTGTPTQVTTFTDVQNGVIIDDIEALSFYNDGSMYVSTGDNYSVVANRNLLYHVDPATGLGTKIGPLTPTPGPKDFEALACLTAEAAIVLEKYTNGPGQPMEDADTPTGPQIPVGETVTWTYIFTNTSVLTLTNLNLTDDQLGDVAPLATNSCLPTGITLPPGQSITCTVTGIAELGQYSNVGTVTAVSEPGLFPALPVTSTDPSHYIGVLPSEPAINIIKFTNGEDADVPTGPIVEVGSTVTWTYEVRNVGNVPLSNVTVTDDQAGITPVYVSGDTDSDSLLDLDEVWLFQATGTAVAGQYANIGTVTGTPPDGPPVTDDNPSHYFGSSSPQPGINITKFTNGEDADNPTGPIVEIGTTVTWTYEVRNTGQVPLSNVTVTDDQPGVTPVYVSGDTDGDSLLDTDEVWLFQATGIAVAGQYANVGTVTGNPPDGPPVTDDNPSHYFGATGSQPGINIIKFTNGEDADEPTGPTVEIGSTVTWTYEVRNTGNVPLSNVTVTDDQAGVTPVYISGDTNGNDLLDLGEVWLFRATGTAVAGQYANIGTVTGTPPDGPPVTDDNPSHYFGAEGPLTPGIEIIKFTNGEDADSPQGPFVEIGTTVTWTYEVRNTGQVPLSNITVTDDQPGVTPTYVSGDTNGNDLLDLDEVWLFQATGIAVAGQYANIGTVTGTPPDGPPVTDDNPSHYFGVDELPPTNLPEEEQPQQQRQDIFLPSIESDE